MIIWAAISFSLALSTFLNPFSFLKDINSWLVTFGFHLHNTIPGFPVPKFDLSMPSYELRKSQRWDDLPVGEMNLICMLPTIVLKVERGRVG